MHRPILGPVSRRGGGGGAKCFLARGRALRANKIAISIMPANSTRGMESDLLFPFQVERCVERGWRDVG